MESSGSIKKYRKPDIITKPSEPILIISSDEDEDMNLNDLKGKLKEKEKTSNKTSINKPKKPSNVIEVTEEENKMMLAINHLKKLGKLTPDMNKRLQANSVFKNLNKKLTKFQQDHGHEKAKIVPIFKVVDGPINKNQTQKDSKKEVAKKSEHSQSQTKQTSKSSTNQAPTSQKRKIEVPDKANKQLKIQVNDKVCSNKKDPTLPKSKKIEEKNKIDYENEIKALKKEKNQLEKDIKKWFWGL